MLKQNIYHLVANRYDDEECSWWQIVHSSCCRVGDFHSTDFKRLFSLLLYDFLTLTPLLSHAAILPAW
jgi:hypothetical protein